MRKLKYITALLAGLFILSFSCSASALELNYSGGSVSGNTGAGNTTSGYSLTVISPTYGNNVGYRFSVVNRYGNLKAGSSVVNVYLSDTQYGESTYSSAQRFVAAGGVLANKKQLAGGTSVYGALGVQAGDYLSKYSEFYYTPSQNPASIRAWIQDSSLNFHNLNNIYYLCSAGGFGTDDYVLIEPILRITLAGTVTAATPTELAVYGAAVSGGGGYNGANGNLSNTGENLLLNFTNNQCIILSADKGRRNIMPNIKPVSDLRNYNEVLRDIAVGEPVFLTKNGRGRYAIIDIAEYERTQAILRLMSELNRGEASAKADAWKSISDVERMFGISDV